MDGGAAASPRPPRGSFDDVYRANGSELLSVASSSSLALSATGDKRLSLLDDDAVMSDGNDAMSETSSLEIDAADSAALEQIALEACDAMDLLLDDQDDVSSPPTTTRKPRPASFHGIRGLAGAPDSPQTQSLSHQPLARAASFGPSLTVSSPQPLTTVWGERSSGTLSTNWPISPRKRKRKIMFLHCHFAPAMSKNVERGIASPHPELVESEDDDLMNGSASSSAEHPSCDNANATPRPIAKVEWANEESLHDDREGAHLVAAKNQVVGTQLRVLSNEPFQLTTDRTNWFLAQGHTPRCRVHVETAYLPQSIQVQVLLIGYVEDENGERIMETLEKRTSSEALALEHALYVRVRVGGAVIEGNYEIPVRLFTQHAGFTDEALSWTTTLSVRVANVTLPPPSQYAFHLDLWQHHCAIARAYGGVPLWSDAHFTLIDRYFASLAELGQKCVTIVATEMPWAGQQCYNETTYPSPLFEHAVLDVYEDDKGEMRIDFQYFDRLVALAERHHMAAEIEVFGVFSIWRDPANGFGTPVEAASVASYTPEELLTTNATTTPPPVQARKPPVPSTKATSVVDKPLDSWRVRCVSLATQRVRYLRSMAEIERFITLFYGHCVSRGLVDRVRVCADEPSDLAAFYAQMAFLERLAPQFRVKVALNHFDFLQHAPPQVVDVVPLLPLVCADLEVTNRWRRHIRESTHGKFCWYVCCGPSYPNQFVSSPLSEAELVGFLTHFLGLDGFLRWNFCLWPARPWQNLKWRSPMWKVGDMYFVLPGLDGSPVETLRYEAMRFAVQSYELLRLAESHLPRPEFERLQGDVASLVWRSPGHAQFGRYLERAQGPEDLYSLDPMDYERARSLVIDALALAESLEPSDKSTVATGSVSTSTPPASVSVEGEVMSPPRQTRPTSPRKRTFHGP